MPGIFIHNARIIDASGGEPFAGSVRIQGNRIAAVNRGDASNAEVGDEMIDASGATLMPGLIEAHAHISFCDTPTLEDLGDIPPEEHTLETVKFAKKMFDQGFTSLFSAAAAKPRLDVVIRNAIDAGDIVGPRMRAASPELTVTGGLGDVRLHHIHRETFAICCDGPDEFRRTAREMCREGVDTLKINPSGDEFIPFARAHLTVMNEDEIAAVCEVGKSRGKMVAVHARSALSVKLCLKHGADVIYHATLCDEEARDMLEARKDEIFVAPAMGIMFATSQGEGAAWGLTKDSDVAIHFARELERCVENMKDLAKRGVRILPGGDYGFAWNPIGTNARDLEHFVNLLDFTPMQAIEACCAYGGELMGLPGELGQIREGWLADLVVVDGDPSKDIRLLQDAEKFLGIMKDGTFHKRPSDAGRGSAEVAA
ncbi:MAG: amidohydrolase family protein [Pseudomonadota bacterium]